MFLPKIKNGNSICQTAGDALIIFTILFSNYIIYSSDYFQVYELFCIYISNIVLFFRLY